MQHVTQTFGLLLSAHVILSAYLPEGKHMSIRVFNKELMLLTSTCHEYYICIKMIYKHQYPTSAAPKSRDFIFKGMRWISDTLCYLFYLAFRCPPLSLIFVGNFKVFFPKLFFKSASLYFTLWVLPRDTKLQSTWQTHKSLLFSSWTYKQSSWKENNMFVFSRFSWAGEDDEKNSIQYEKTRKCTINLPGL